MYLLTNNLHGQSIAVRLQRGGDMASYWGALGIGIVCGTVVWGVMSGLSLTLPLIGLLKLLELVIGSN